MVDNPGYGPYDIHRLSMQTVEVDFQDEGGWILDIGGGGEGIIGQLKGSRVVAIDRLRSELEEAKGDALKCIMDATDLKFLDGAFATATAFFSIMFIPKNDLDKVFSEVARVLRPGGHFLLWDLIFEPPEGFIKPIVVVPLTVVLPGGRVIETGYGMRARQQDMDGFIALARGHGLEPVERSRRDETFFVRFVKG